MSADEVQALIERALRHHQQGARAEARSLYQAALGRQPDHAACHYYLGILLHEMADPAGAIRHLANAARLRPDQSAWISDLGAVCTAAGNLPGAIAAFSRLVQLEPGRADAWGQLGDLHRTIGDAGNARQCYARALALAPGMTAASHNLALLLIEARALDAALVQLDVAEAHAPGNAALLIVRGKVHLARQEARIACTCFERALEIDGSLDEARLNLGLALIELGDLSAAEAAFTRIDSSSAFHALALAGMGDIAAAHGKNKRAIQFYDASLAVRPDQASVLNNLGMALTNVGQARRAVAMLSRAATLAPRSGDVLSNLANALLAVGDTGAATDTLRKAIGLAPVDARFISNLGNALWVAGNFGEAEQQCRHAVELDPTLGAAWGNLGTVLRDQARFEEAVNCYRRAVALEPESTAHLSNLLYGLCYVDDVSQAQLLAEHREYSRRFEAPLSASNVRHGNSRVPDRKLRIGYVSADFRNHPVAQFIIPLLKAHDRAAFEIFAYSSTPHQDDITRECQAAADHWIECLGLEDDEMAERIRADSIDVLIDLSGHTAGNRLPVFCRRPAPLQIAYLGYPATTGLDAIGYRFSDQVIDPPDAAEGFSEKLVRLERGLYALPVADEWPAPDSLPCLRNGHMTFASFNNANKLVPECLALWQRIMNHHVDSRMLFLAVPEGPVRDRIVSSFARAGIAAERLRFEGRLPRRLFLARMAEADVALDSFPMTGGTTTIESLCMGIPVVSLLGRRHASRVSASFLASAGLDRLVARDAEDYMRIVDELVSAPESLATLRASLREQVAGSPLADVDGLARRMESALRGLWHDWCGKNEQ